MATSKKETAKKTTSKEKVVKDEKVVQIETFELSELIPEDVSEDFKDLYGRLNVSDITKINPLIPVLNKIQEFKTIVYDENNEKESVREYKDAIKYLGSFNTSIKNIRKELKEPYSEVISKIDSVFNHLSNEYSNSRNSLLDNFKVYLDRKEEEKKAAEEKKKQKELELIKELEEKNNIIIEKQKAQEENIRYYGFLTKVTEYQNEQMKSFDSLSLDDLESKKGYYNFITIEEALDGDVLSLSGNYLNQLQSKFDEALKILGDDLNRRIALIKEQSSKNEETTTPSVPPVPTVPGVPLNKTNDFVDELKGQIPDEFLPDSSGIKDPYENIDILKTELENIRIRLIKFVESFRDDIHFDNSVMEKTRVQLHGEVLPKIADQCKATIEWINKRMEMSKKHN